MDQFAAASATATATTTGSTTATATTTTTTTTTGNATTTGSATVTDTGTTTAATAAPIAAASPGASVPLLRVATAPRWARVEQIMGMPISLHVRGHDAERHVVEAAFAMLRTTDRLFSTYRPDSAVSRLNRGEITVAQCSPLVAQVIGLAEQARRRTGGYFDATIPGLDGVPRFDPSGLVKGWAVERAGGLLADLGLADFYLNGGGDIVARAPEDSRPWLVGVADPTDARRVLAVLPLRTGGVATSGIATSGSARRGARITAPRTARPAAGPRAITVVGPSLLWADVYATAALVRGAEGLDWIAAQDGYDALSVEAGGRLRATPGMQRLLAAGTVA